jgi:hypothetical protein
LFDFYRKVNYFGEILVLFLLFYFVGYGHRERLGIGDGGAFKKLQLNICTNAQWSYKC